MRKLLVLLSIILQCLSQSPFTIVPTDTVSMIDGNATLQCAVGNFMPGDVMQWYRHDSQQFITEGLAVLDFNQRAYIEGSITAYSSGHYNLIMPQLEMSDAGNYSCTYRALGSQDVIGSLPATVTVLHNPLCTQNPRLAEVVGQSVHMTCSLDDRDVDNDAVTNVQWTRKGSVISSDPIRTTALRYLTGEDNHEKFVCQLIVTGTPTIIRSCSLTLLSINPSATIYPTGLYRISQNQFLEFECYPTAYPHVSSIDWLINEESIYEYVNVFKFALSSDRRTFKITVILDEGASYFTYLVKCRVYDPMRFIGDSSPTTIIVEPVITLTTPTPSTTQKLVTTPTPVIIVQTPSNVTSTSGSTIVLDCSVNSIADGEMKWFYVEENIYILVGLEVTSTSDDIKSRYSIVGGSNAYSRGQYALQITNAKVSDSGTYFCSYASTTSSRSIFSPLAYVSINMTPVNIYTTLSLASSILPNEAVSFVKTPSDTSTSVGSVVILECSVNNLADGQMKWFKVESSRYIMVGLDVSISASDDIRGRYSIFGGSEAYSRGKYNLQIMDVKNSDRGTYLCSYSSSGGSSSISSNFAKLTLLAELVCHKDPNHALPSGALVTLNCMVHDAREMIPLTWLNNLGSLTVSKVNSVAYTFVLQPTDNYKIFTCFEVTESADYFARTCSLIPMAIPPVVKIVEGDSEVAGGTAINFTCQAEAVPYVSRYEWLINGNTLTTFNNSFDVNIENDGGILGLLPLFSDEHDKVYNITCTVYIPSGQSKTSKSAHLHVTSRNNKKTSSTNDHVVILAVVLSITGIILFIAILLLLYALNIIRSCGCIGILCGMCGFRGQFTLKYRKTRINST